MNNRINGIYQRRHGDQTVVSIQGPMLATSMIELYQTVMKVVEDSGCTVVDLRDASSLPVSAFQVLCLAFRKARSRGADFEIRGRLPDPLGHVIRMAGLDKGRSCKNCDPSVCLWQSHDGDDGTRAGEAVARNGLQG